MCMEFSVLNFLDASALLYEKFSKSEPFAAGKIGNAELMCAYNYFVYKHRNQPVQWSPTVEQETCVNAGVFPKTEQARVNFAETLAESLKNMDVVASWNGGLKEFEQRLILSSNKDCTLVELTALEPFYSGIPWSTHLKGKNVLVVSPFVESIKNQYKNRSKLWANPSVLPDFNLITLYHPTSKAVSAKQNKYDSWQHMVEDMKEQMSKIAFDVALIGTGASSLPLTVHAKTLGKQAIHLGGPLQILFGIRGKRWDNMKIFSQFFYNEHWIRPSENEIPAGYKAIEDGCYW